MGYTTTFSGQVTIEPPLNAAEVAYLNRFSGSRRMDRAKGPYYAEPGSSMGQDRSNDIIDYNMPDPTQPGLWCHWVPNEDGTALEWDGGEKAYDSVEWMGYMIDHFLKPEAEAARSGDPQFSSFTFNHVVNGTIDAQGEEAGDMWKLVVKDNVVSTVRPTIVWPDTAPIVTWPDDDDE